MIKNKKKNGFTLIELIIALAITVVIIGVVYTFGIVNQKSLATAQVKSTLQNEGNAIQKELISIGTQGRNITGMDIASVGNVDPGTTTYTQVDTISNTIELSKLTIATFPKQDDLTKIDEYTYYLKEGPDGPTDEKWLYLKKSTDTGDGKVLSRNVKSFTVTPLDYQSVPDKSVARFSNATGLRITIEMHIKQGYSNVTYPVTTIVNFRNRTATT